MPERIPVDLVFNPTWWYRTAGISFDESFYLDSNVRISNDVTMRCVLHERFGALGLGEANPQSRPVIGSLHVAGGFVIPAMLGCAVRFEKDSAPQPLPHRLTLEQVDSFQKPDSRQTWPMNILVSQMDELERDFGYLVGDLDVDSPLNTAYHFWGHEMFAAFYEHPARLQRFLRLIAELQVEVAGFIRERTGTCGVATNRMVVHSYPAAFVNSNCSVQMISPRTYRDYVLPVEKWMAEHIHPYGIHHCGNALQLYASTYAETSAVFYDVGWGSDIARCRALLPGAFLSLRLSPIRMLQCSPAEIAVDTETLLRSAGDLQNIGVCCINMDYGTPDENIFAMVEVVEKYRNKTG